MRSPVVRRNIQRNIQPAHRRSVQPNIRPSPQRRRRNVHQNIRSVAQRRSSIVMNMHANVETRAQCMEKRNVYEEIFLKRESLEHRRRIERRSMAMPQLMAMPQPRVLLQRLSPSAIERINIGLRSKTSDAMDILEDLKALFWLPATHDVIDVAEDFKVLHLLEGTILDV